MGRDDACNLEVAHAVNDLHVVTVFQFYLLKIHQLKLSKI